MKEQKVVVIDPVTATIREEMWNGKLDQLYKWTRCTFVRAAKAEANGLILWVDEDGGMKSKRTPQWFHPMIYPIPIVGAAVVSAANTKLPENLKDELMKEMKWGLLFNPHDDVAAPNQH